MAVNEKFEQIMADEGFVADLDNAKSYDDLKERFSAEGVNIDEIFAGATVSGELSEEDLDAVTGGAGLNPKKIIQLATTIFNPVNAFKYGANIGILMRAYYDTTVYKNATRTYTEKQIINAARGIGLNVE